jgi:dihydroxyacetone kinase-like predicted kinase
MKYMLAVLLSLCLLYSCDPLRRINMKNRSGEDADIIWTLLKDSAKTSLLFISNDEEVKFHLKTNRPKNEANMSFGIGSWTNEMLKSLADDLESLHINTNKDSLHLKTTADIWKYLSDRKKGFGKNKIQITLN